MKEYDARSNLLSECVVPKERLGSACSVASGDLKTQYTYKEARTVIACDYPASCNRVATETSPIASALTNPAGAITEYSWDDQTGLLTRIVKPADLDGRRPQIDATYEKLTGSDALFLKEKTEKINAADTLITKYEYDTAKKFALKAVVLDAGGKNIRTCYGFDAKGDVASVTDARAASCP